MGQDPQIERLLEYQQASNQHVSAVSIGFFSTDGMIAMHGKEYSGPQALFDAHEFDRGSGTLISLGDFVVEGASVNCSFRTENDFDRVVGTGGSQASARFTFAEHLIQRFEIFPPSDEEVARLRAMLAPVFAWVRANHSDLLASGGGFDYQGGAVIGKSAALYAHHLAATAEGAEAS